MKRLASQPITAFFQRKQSRRRSIESVDSDASASPNTHPADQVEEIQDEEGPNEPPTTKRNAHARREAREDVTGILQRRELGPRRRRKQQLVRWALTHSQRLPVELQLAPHWERQAGAMNNERFYASCLEFDAQGVLLAAGASNGIVALYDFDDVFHRSLNLGQVRKDEEEPSAADTDVTEVQQEVKLPDEILHPIHTIFTPFEVKCIRWNPSNEDEIACSFSNRNEIHLFNLRKFPSKPHKVLKSSNHPSSGIRPPGMMKQKSRARTTNVIAGDTDGAIRMWDVRSPMRPIWSFLTGSQPINSIVLSPNKQCVICGNEAGMLMTYDIQHKIVPAFGSKPVPQRRASLNIMEAIKLPHSETQVLCQLRNDWVVVIDYLVGSVVKLHTSIRGLPKQKSKSDASPSVLSAAAEMDSQRDFLPRSLRNSWLSCHRCTGTFLFDESIMCTGIHDATNLNIMGIWGPRTGST
uniref:Uncharacterized protein n=1 Tax=Phytophthora ramorum TaxID=164328 RepID=H3HBX0_PHYRM